MPPSAPARLLVAAAATATLAAACFDLAGANCGDCRPGCDQCTAAPFDNTSPQFHIRDLSCGENDPNFPLYDPLHKLYHHFWQAHLATPPGHGPDIGHAVSADLVTWGGLRASAQ